MREYAPSPHESTDTQSPAAADGILEAGDEGVILDTDTDGRPEACECGEFHTDTDLPCWPCYRDGFDTPASSEVSDS